MKNIFFILFLVLFCSFSFSAIPAYTDLYVNDFADVFTIEQENELTTLLSQLTTETTAEVVVVTVNSLEGYAPIDYATQIGQTWGVGKKDTDNGLVILYAKAENKIAVATGYGLEGILPDSKVGRILDEQYVPLRNQGNASQGIINATKEYSSVISLNKNEVGSLAVQDNSIDPSLVWIILIILIIASTAVLVAMKKSAFSFLPKMVLGVSIIIMSFFFSEPLSMFILFFGVIIIMQGTHVGGGSFGSGSSWGGGHGGGFSGGGSFGGGSFGGGGASR